MFIRILFFFLLLYAAMARAAEVRDSAAVGDSLASERLQQRQYIRREVASQFVSLEDIYMDDDTLESVMKPRLRHRRYATRDEYARQLREEARRGVYEFKVERLIIPSMFIAFGSWRFTDNWMVSANEGVRSGMESLRSNHYFHADDYIQYLPAAAHLGIEYFGVPARNNIVERLFITANSWAVMGVLVNATKYSVGSLRPDKSSHNSFPSGHTATAFMGAEMVRIQYGAVAGISSYTVATLTGILRMYNNRHWLNDVIAGAGIGILSARIGNWLLPLERRWFKLDKLNVKHRKIESVAIVPACNIGQESFATNLSITF